jgi:two-component system chemotaxis sensor kinase CheA
MILRSERLDGPISQGETMRNPEIELLLREQIDDLSTRLLMAEPDGEASGDWQTPFLTAFGQLARQAGEAGYDEAALIAAGLSAGGCPLAEFEEGLARLQQAVTDAGANRLSEKIPEKKPEKPKQEAPPAIFSLADDPELVADFIVESREHLNTIEQRVLTLEREPRNAEAVNSVFRGFHTIKGLAGFLEFSSIQEVAHDVETALNLAREGTLAITSAVTDVILASVDYLSRSIAAVESGSGCRPMSGHDQLLVRIRAMMAGSAVQRCDVSPPEPDSAAPLTIVQEPMEIPAPRQAKGKQATAESSSVRVDTARLDYLVDMVSETVIAQSMIRHNRTLATLAADPVLQRDLAQLSRLTGEVQKTAMAMRMVPIGQLFQRTNRQVRDLSRKVGKQVELVTHGEDTELDKNIAEQLADPLMHMVRNSVDHGVETPELREAAGKTALARITLSAYHRAGQIVIEVADDGRGLDTRRILAKARQRGLIEDAAHLPEAEVFRLILEPGFSTAETVSDISGRGVGMDVVRQQVEKLRGRIEIRSQVGLGTTFLLKLPLTMAIIDGLVVSIGSRRYIVPLYAVTEMFRPAAESLFSVRNRQEMVMVRDRLLPVLRLYRRFGIVPRTEDPCQALLIVAESEGRQFCLLVDDLIGKQEVVIKSLGEGLGNIPGIAGGAILGDGRVGLILDMGGLWGARADF